MNSAAFLVFDRLEQQILAIREAVAREVAAGNPHVAPALLRSCVVLAVAAFDTYMHEQGVRLLGARTAVGQVEATDVARYLGRVTLADITGVSAQGYIRYGLSYKTLTQPDKVDALLTAAGLSPQDVWLRSAMGLGSRPERLRLQTQLQCDRRNQIAHEGDWDHVSLDFRPLEEAHVNDCLSSIRGLVTQFDMLLV